MSNRVNIWIYWSKEAYLYILSCIIHLKKPFTYIDKLTFWRARIPIFYARLWINIHVPRKYSSMTLFYCWNWIKIVNCKNQNQTTTKSECSYQLSNLKYLINYFKHPELFLIYLLTNMYLSNLIYGGSLTLLRQGFSNLSGDLQGKLFEGFSLYGLRWPHWVQLFSEWAFLFF